MKVLLVEIQYNAMSYMAGAALKRRNIEHSMLLKRCQAVVSEREFYVGWTYCVCYCVYNCQGVEIETYARVHARTHKHNM